MIEYVFDLAKLTISIKKLKQLSDRMKKQKLDLIIQSKGETADAVAEFAFAANQLNEECAGLIARTAEKLEMARLTILEKDVKLAAEWCGNLTGKGKK